MKDKSFLNQLELKFHSYSCRIRDLEAEVRILKAEIKRHIDSKKLT